MLTSYVPGNHRNSCRSLANLQQIMRHKHLFQQSISTHRELHDRVYAVDRTLLGLLQLARGEHACIKHNH